MYERCPPWLARCLGGVRTPAGASCLAALLATSTLFAGFFFDDYIHLLTLEGRGYGATPLDLFRFATGDAAAMADQIGVGPYPWYTLQELKIHFFRPLSSLGMWLDHQLFGEHAFFYHLHSLIWYALLACAAAMVYGRALPPATAGLAILLFVLDEGHVVPALWWSNRNALVSVAPALFGLAAHLRWRERGWRPGLILSLAGYGAGLLGGETALGIFGYVVAYEWLGRRATVWERLRGTAPALLVAAGYLALYSRAGYGVTGSGVYFDPVGEWGLFLRHAPGRFLELAGVQFFSLPVELAVLSGAAHGVLLVVSAVGMVALGIVVRQTWRALPEADRLAVAWLGAGACLAAVPVLATFPSGRLLTLPSVGGCALIAVVLRGAFAGASDTVSGFRRGMGHLLVVLHLALAPMAWLAAGAGIPFMISLTEDAFREARVDPETARNQFCVTIFAAEPYTGFYPAIMRRALDLPETRGWQTLSLAPFDHAVTRTGEGRFEVRVLGGELLSTPFERLLRGQTYRFGVGEVVDAGEFQVEILEMGRHGPSHFAVTFPRSLEAPAYAFLAWQAGQLQPFSWPPIGESRVFRVNEGYFAWRYFKKRLGLV